ncbi:uncharacterized protein LOC124504184 isoform X1 [Lynx rufus]|uniref:uncharacterized protein LOC124504184 isoform X1 n=1 Tax=Lynx rufus TaxID=61384 RepID=UPI001F126292|nr:uncharacterized protein LOC124504184 isoform X1 [Lynx rufus]
MPEVSRGRAVSMCGVPDINDSSEMPKWVDENKKQIGVPVRTGSARKWPRGRHRRKAQKPRSRSAASRRVSTADSGQRPAGARGRAYAGLKWPHKSAIVLRGVARQSVSCTSHRETLCRGIWRLVRAQRLPPAPSLALGCQGTGQLLGTPAWAASGETALGGCSGTEVMAPSATGLAVTGIVTGRRAMACGTLTWNVRASRFVLHLMGSPFPLRTHAPGSTRSPDTP